MKRSRSQSLSPVVVYLVLFCLLLTTGNLLTGKLLTGKLLTGKLLTAALPPGRGLQPGESIEVKFGDQEYSGEVVRETYTVGCRRSWQRTAT